MSVIFLILYMFFTKSLNFDINLQLTSHWQYIQLIYINHLNPLVGFSITLLCFALFFSSKLRPRTRHCC